MPIKVIACCLSRQTCMGTDTSSRAVLARRRGSCDTGSLTFRHSANANSVDDETLPPATKQTVETQYDEESRQDDWATLSDMLIDEIAHVRALRTLRNQKDGTLSERTVPRSAKHHARRYPKDLFGLALSGGGNSQRNLFVGRRPGFGAARVDSSDRLHSSVSGGGYIASWLSACILRAREAGVDDPVREVESRIAPRNIKRAGEPTERKLLRAYSNYLTPRSGLFSGDTLAALVGFFEILD